MDEQEKEIEEILRTFDKAPSPSSENSVQNQAQQNNKQPRQISQKPTDTERIARSARKTAGRQTLRCPQSTHCSISRRSAAIMNGFGISEAHRHQMDRCPVSCRRQAGALRGATVLRGTACCSGFRMR